MSSCSDPTMSASPRNPARAQRAIFLQSNQAAPVGGEIWIFVKTALPQFPTGILVQCWRAARLGACLLPRRSLQKLRLQATPSPICLALEGSHLDPFHREQSGLVRGISKNAKPGPYGHRTSHFGFEGDVKGWRATASRHSGGTNR